MNGRAIVYLEGVGAFQTKLAVVKRIASAEMIGIERGNFEQLGIWRLWRHWRLGRRHLTLHQFRSKSIFHFAVPVLQNKRFRVLHRSRSLLLLCHCCCYHRVVHAAVAAAAAAAAAVGAAAVLISRLRTATVRCHTYWHRSTAQQNSAMYLKNPE